MRLIKHQLDRDSQQGIVSLTISIIIAVLLIIVVTSIIIIMIRAQRESTDSDLSTRAYYAAEAGVEDALIELQRKLIAGTLSEADFTAMSSCNSSTPGELTGTTYTCQRMTHQTNLLEGDLQADGQPVQLDLGAVNFSKIVFKWNNANDSTDDKDNNAVGTSSYVGPGSNFPGTSSLPGKTWPYPGVLEVSTIAFPAGPGGFNIASDPNYNFYSNIILPGKNPTPKTNAPDSNAKLTGDCTNASGYNCEMTFDKNNIAGDGYVLRLRSRYRGTHYSVQLLDNTNTPITVPDQWVTIDVTAQSGDVFRRIVYKVRLTSGAAAVDYAIYSDTDICKDFQVSLGVATGCPY